jgi:hypothetical protein
MNAVIMERRFSPDKGRTEGVSTAESTFYLICCPNPPSSFLLVCSFRISLRGAAVLSPSAPQGESGKQALYPHPIMVASRNGSANPMAFMPIAQNEPRRSFLSPSWRLWSKPRPD